MTIYTDTETSTEIELAKYDAALLELDIAADEAENPAESLKAQYAFVQKAFSASKVTKDWLKEYLGGDKYDSIDLSLLSPLVLRVRAEYKRPFTEAQQEVNAEQYRQLEDMTKNLADVAEAAKAVQGMTEAEKAIVTKQMQPNRQGFKRLK